MSDLVALIEPRHDTANELELYRYRLPKTQATKTGAWLEGTGRVGDERYELEAESMPVDRLQEMVKKAVVRS